MFDATTISTTRFAPQQQELSAGVRPASGFRVSYEATYLRTASRWDDLFRLVDESTAGQPEITQVEVDAEIAAYRARKVS